MILLKTKTPDTYQDLYEDIAVEIFSTNVNEKITATSLVDILARHLPDHTFNFDLEDCDRILRAKTVSGSVKIEMILKLVASRGVVIFLFKD